MPVCRRCGQDNPDVARLCMVCGTPFPTTTARGREERKVVTAIFVDMVGFTGQAEAMDVEDVRGTLVPYHALLRRELERFGGTVEKFIGDAVMALFGAPVAHEDDPERAVRAALAIRDAVAELAEAEAGLDLHVRIGVNTGEALIAIDARPEQGESMAAGDVVNTAARLQTAAPVDGVLVGELTYRATAPAIEYRPAAPVDAKGKAEPLPAWEAVGARARLGVDVRQATQTPLVGREPQLRMLEAALDQARRDCTPQLVTLVGVPGIGKSRLVWELLQVVDRDDELITWRQGRSLPYGDGVTFWAVGEMVKAQAGILESDSEAEAGDKLTATVGTLVADDRERAWLLGHLRPLVGLGGDAGGAVAESFAAWRRFFEAIAERGPAVLVFEDLHWADDVLLDFVDHLVEWSGDVPMLVLGTARPELLDRRSDWGGGKPNSLLVSLAPLSDADTARLIAGVLEQAVLPAATQASLLTLAEGNPLYAEEYVRMLVDRGLLVQGRGGWSLASDAELPLPESVGGIIAARLDMLPADEKALLQDAAVLGKVFWPGALGDISPQLLHALERKQFIRRERHSSVAGEPEYAFRHALMRDVAYGQIPRAGRAERHERAAAWIQALAAERPDDHVEMVVHHYTNALTYARAAGLETAELERLARTALRAAGDRAQSLNALGAASRYYDAAAHMWPRDDPDYGAVLLLAGEVTIGPRVESASDHLLEALPILREQGDVESVAKVLRGLAWIAWNRGQGEEADRLFTEALDAVADRPPSATRSQLLEEQARRRMLAGRMAEGLALAEEALGIAVALGLERNRIDCLTSLGTLRAHMADPAGIPELEQALALARDAAYAAGIMRAYKNLASHVFEQGDIDRALELWDEAAAEAERYGDDFEIGWFTVERATAFAAQGHDERAVDLLMPFLARVESGHAHYMECPARETLAAIMLGRGDIDRALALAAQAAAIARPSGEAQTIMPSLSVHAAVLLAAGRTAEASTVATEVIGHLPSEVHGPWMLRLVATLRVLGRAGEWVSGGHDVKDSVWSAAALQLARGDASAARATLAAAGASGVAALCRDDAGPALEGAGAG